MPRGTRRPITFGQRSTLSKVGRMVLTFISTKFASVLVICINTLMFCLLRRIPLNINPTSFFWSLIKHNISILCFFIIICRDTRIDDIMLNMRLNEWDFRPPLCTYLAELCHENLLSKGRYMKWHCPSRKKFDIRTLTD